MIAFVSWITLATVAAATEPRWTIDVLEVLPTGAAVSVLSTQFVETTEPRAVPIFLLVASAKNHGHLTLASKKSGELEISLRDMTGLHAYSPRYRSYFSTSVRAEAGETRTIDFTQGDVSAVGESTRYQLRLKRE